MTSRTINRIGYHLFRRPLYAIMSCFSTTHMPPASDDEIDIVIPAIAKDLQTLPYCLEGIKRNIPHRVKGIYLVGPADERLINFSKEYGLIFINELEVLGFGPKDIDYVTTDGRDRSGWLFQQFIKLSGNIGECQNFLTIDSDHVLLKPHVFITNDGKYVFYRSNEFRWSYIMENYRLLGDFKIPMLSYVSHKMIFNKKILEKLKITIEQKSGEKWTDSIIHTIDRDDSSAFSEFELYASFVDKGQKISKLWLQKALLREPTFNMDNIKNNNPSLLSITYPEYLNK